MPLNRRIGLIELGAGRFAVGIAAPFGRVETEPASQARGRDRGPWRRGDQAFALARALCRVTQPANRHRAFLMPRARDGLIIDPRDPLLQIEACPGAPGCRRPPWTHGATGAGLRVCCRDFVSPGQFMSPAAPKGVRSPGRPTLCSSVPRAVMASCATERARDHATRRLSFAELAADPGKIFGIDRGHGHD